MLKNILKMVSISSIAVYLLWGILAFLESDYVSMPKNVDTFGFIATIAAWGVFCGSGFYLNKISKNIYPAVLVGLFSGGIAAIFLVITVYAFHLTLFFPLWYPVLTYSVIWHDLTISANYVFFCSFQGAVMGLFGSLLKEWR